MSAPVSDCGWVWWSWQTAQLKPFSGPLWPSLTRPQRMQQATTMRTVPTVCPLQLHSLLHYRCLLIERVNGTQRVDALQINADGASWCWPHNHKGSSIGVVAISCTSPLGCKWWVCFAILFYYYFKQIASLFEINKLCTSIINVIDDLWWNDIQNSIARLVWFIIIK